MNYFTLQEDEIINRARGSERGNCVDVRGGLTRTGEKVECRASGSAGGRLVGEVIGISDRQDVIKAELRKYKLLRGDSRERLVLIRQFPGVREKTIDVSKYSNVPATLTEVESTQNLEWIKADYVTGIAFVFHLDDIDAGKYLCGGIRNSYFIRDGRSVKNERRPIAADECEAFPFPHSMQSTESYSKRIWNGIAACSELSSKALSSRGKWDGRNKHIHMVGANSELFSYITDGIESECGDAVINDTFHCGRAKKRMNANLSVCNKRIKTRGKLVRLLDGPVLEEMRSTVGSAFGIGITKAVPTMKEIASSEGRVSDTVHLKEHDVVRVVTCNLEDLDFDPEKDVAPCPVFSNSGMRGDTAMDNIRSMKKQPRLLPFPGIDIEFLQSETGLTDSHFNLKFKKLLGGSSTVRMLQCRSIVAAENGEPAGVVVGDQLVKDGVSYSVKSVTGDTVECVRHGGGKSVTLTAEETIALVDAYLDQ